MIKVLLHANSLPDPTQGGGNVSTWETIRSLQHFPVAVYVAVLPGQRVEADYLAAHFPKIHVVPGGSPAELIRLIDELGIDVFHTKLMDAGEVLAHCRRRGIPGILEVKHPSLAPLNWLELLRQGTVRGYREIGRMQQLRRCARLADLVIVPSAYSKGRVNARFGIPAERIRVLRNGIDLKEFQMPDDPARFAGGVTRFICVGRLERDKRTDLLIRAFAAVQRQHPHARLDIVGDGSKRETLNRLVGRLRLRNVQFLGWVGHRQIVQLYQSSHVLLHASTRESFCNVVAEAMACGLACIAANVGALPELVTDGRTGFLVDRPGDFARKALELIADPARAQRVGEAAHREMHRNYDWEKKAQGFWEAYGALAAQQKTATTDLVLR